MDETGTLAFLLSSLRGVCPRCHRGSLYEGPYSLTIRKTCDVCGLNLARNDSADGPAVFLIFVLGFALVPLALLLDHLVEIPLWVHGILWTVVALSATLGALRPLKSLVIALQYRHRPEDWSEDKDA